MPKRGRPSKYKPEMCGKVIEWMKAGWSVAEVCSALEIDKDTFYEWSQREGKYFKPDFSDAVKLARIHSEGWWTKQGRTHIENNKFNTPLWINNMANRFHWNSSKEKIDQRSVNKNVNVDLTDDIIEDDDKREELINSLLD